MEILAEPLRYDRGLECIPNLGGRGCRIDLREKIRKRRLGFGI